MSETSIDVLFEAGAHFGYGRARRHPTATQYLFGTKDRTDIFDLEATTSRIDTAVAYAASLAAAGKQLLFIGGKHEAISIVKAAAERAGQPYCAGRWIGGTLTNFKNIRKRVDLLEKLIADRESGALDKYTKKERVLIDRQIDRLIARFGGLTKMQDLPAALFIVDSRHEDTAVKEANQLKIPVIGLSSSDCNFSLVQYPIPANDTSVRSISLVCGLISDGYQNGRSAAPKVATPAAK